MRRYKMILFLFIIVIMPLSVEDSAFCNGGKSKRVLYQGSDQAYKSLICSIELEEMIFLINSVEGKYKVLRIRIQNWGKEMIKLSKKDKVMIYVKERQIPLEGILDISQWDKDTWSRFPEDLRNRLIYPERVEKGEEESVFIFAPIQELKSLPERIEYTLDNRKIIIEKKEPAKR